MSIDISIHSCVSIRAERKTSNGSTWIDFTLTCKDSREQVVTVFFSDPIYASRLTAAINEAAWSVAEPQ